MTISDKDPQDKHTKELTEELTKEFLEEFTEGFTENAEKKNEGPWPQEQILAEDERRAIHAWDLEYFMKVMDAEADVIIRLYTRLVQAENYVEKLLTTFREDGIVLVDKDNRCIAEWLTDMSNRDFLGRVKEKYMAVEDDE